MVGPVEGPAACWLLLAGTGTGIAVRKGVSKGVGDSVSTDAGVRLDKDM